MRIDVKILAVVVLTFLIGGIGTLMVETDGADAGPEDREAALAALGASLFFDTDLSLNRTMACATCHAPDAGFADPRQTAAGGAVSLGDDGVSFGDRNTPSAAYAAFAPPFHRRADGTYAGGQFLDGRAADLEQQAGGPPLNPLEMAMPDKATVVGRLKERSDYAGSFQALFGPDIFGDVEAAYDAMTKAIASYERSAEFAPFDSKYDRYLRGEYKMTDQEELGRVLFFSRQFTNCNLCHQLKPAGAAGETFTNYAFHNIGVPANAALPAVTGRAQADLGLAANPAVDDPAAVAGKFKVPGLRNVAVTGPYMHNGVFKDLRTVILFYNRYNTKAARRQIDPETGQTWAAPETPSNIALTELETGPALDDRRIDALVAFLKTLTDRRYEPLLGAPPVPKAP